MKVNAVKTETDYKRVSLHAYEIFAIASLGLGLDPTISGLRASSRTCGTQVLQGWPGGCLLLRSGFQLS